MLKVELIVCVCVCVCVRVCVGKRAMFGVFLDFPLPDFYYCFILIFLFVYVCEYVGVHMPWHTHRSQRITCRGHFFPSTMWATGFKLRSLDLVVP